MKKPTTDPPGCTLDILAMNDTLEILGGKWKLLILHYLITRENENTTFKKIERELNGISAKVLSNDLKELEQNQLISRKELDTKPITVQYSISEYGKSVQEIIELLVKWGKLHREKLINNK